MFASSGTSVKVVSVGLIERKGELTGVDHNEGIQPGVRVEHVGIQGGWYESLVGGEEYTGLVYRVATPALPEFLVWHACRDMEVKGRVQGREDVGDDVHLMQTFHEQVELSVLAPALFE